MSDPQKTEAALRELLRLYDLRFELAKTEAELLSPEQQKKLASDLRRYGREKKAAWIVAREVLRGGETAIRGSQSSRQLPEGEIPSPATERCRA